MVKACIYCKTGLDESSVVDVCTRCGIGVWGEKMFAAIIDNMSDARSKGDLYQGSVTDANAPASDPKQTNTALQAIATDAIQTQETNPFERQVEKIETPSAPTREDVPALVPESQLQADSFQSGVGESLGSETETPIAETKPSFPENEAALPVQEKEQSASALIGSTF